MLIFYKTHPFPPCTSLCCYPTQNMNCRFSQFLYFILIRYQICGRQKVHLYFNKKLSFYQQTHFVLSSTSSVLRMFPWLQLIEAKFFLLLPRIKFSAFKIQTIYIQIILPLGKLLLISTSELFQQIYHNNEKTSYHILLSVNLVFFDKVANNQEVIDL